MQAAPEHPLARYYTRIVARLLLFVLALSAVTGATATPATADMASAVTAILSDQKISPSEAGIYVWDLDTGRRVYSLNANARFAPASNVKLVTTAAALQTWGVDHRMTTRVVMGKARIAGGIVTGDLYLTGAGDPSLATRSFQRKELGFTSASVDSFARGIRALGVRGIAGGIVGDESWFDDERTVSTWKPGIEVYGCGPLSALCANQGLHDDKRVDDPAVHAAGLLTQALREAGVKVAGEARSGRVPAGVKLIREQSSAPLRVLLRHMNKESDNFFAEVLLKGLGKDTHDLGTTSAGLIVSEAALASMGIPQTDYLLLDGSGLSYGNKLTPHAMVRLLGAMSQRGDFDAFYDSLAVAGEDGTLEERMTDTAAEGNARAKTGTLNVATSLSGYVRSANGHLVSFSILINGDRVDWAKGNKAQDEIVAALAETRLSGRRGARAAPSLRQRPASSVWPVHTSGRALQPCVEP